MTDNTVVIYRNKVTNGPITAAIYGLDEPTMEAFKHRFGHASFWPHYEFYIAMPLEEAKKLGFYSTGDADHRQAWAEKILEQRQQPAAPAAVGKKVRKEYVPDLPVDPSDAMAAVREFCK